MIKNREEIRVDNTLAVNSVRLRAFSEVASVVMLDHTEPEIRRNNVDITLHCYSDDVTGTVNKPAKRN